MKILLNSKQNKYKANLHCHSTFSDGNLTPDELKKVYTENGYSIIAFTDHELLLPHDDLNDEGFLALHGYEIGIDEIDAEKLDDAGKRDCDIIKCHLCLIGREPENLKHICWHRSKYHNWANMPKYIHLAKFDDTLPDYEREYTPECINDIIKTARENGFFVTYNHPDWSLENYSIYSKYRGLNAIEIFNYCCVRSGWDDYNPAVYDDILRGGERNFCIAADDNHNDCKKCGDSFGGFTVILRMFLNIPPL